MDNGNIIDLGVGFCFLLFTGTENINLDNYMLDIISKLGVIAVLWFWLREMRTQMRHMYKNFELETKQIREDHEKQTQRLLDLQKENNDRIDKIVKSKENNSNLAVERKTKTKKL
jgi:hypothetical protein